MILILRHFLFHYSVVFVGEGTEGTTSFCTQAQSNFAALLFGQKTNFNKKQFLKEVCSQREESGSLQTVFRQWKRVQLRISELFVSKTRFCGVLHGKKD